MTADAKQWWYRPTVRGLQYFYGTYPGAGWLPSRTGPPAGRRR